MQFNQCGPFPQWNYGPYNTFIPAQQQCNPVTEIVGEGDVVSTVNVDGSLQFYFVPVLTYPCGFRSLTTPGVASCGAWLIKTISNPIAVSMTNQHGFASQRCLTMPIPQMQSCFMPDNNAKPNYHFKFHNDVCTSTSDLHYFCPDLRTCWWIPPPAPPPPPELPEPPKPQLTYPEFYQQRPNVELPPCECMSVDQETTKRKQEIEKPITSQSSSSRTCMKKTKQDTSNQTETKKKGVRITSSNSSCCSLRSVLNKFKRKTKKQNGNTKRNDSSKGVTSCCSRCECTHRAPKRKRDDTKPTPSGNSSGSLSRYKRKKKKQNKPDTSEIPSSSKEKKEEGKSIQSSYISSQLCLDLCKSKKENQDKGEKSKIPTSNKDKKAETSSSYERSLKSLLEKIKDSLSSLYCTPSKCDNKEQTSNEPAKSSKSDENETMDPASAQSSGISLKGILAKVCSKFEKKKGKAGESTDDKPKNPRCPSYVRILYDSDSKGLGRSSERSMSLDPTGSRMSSLQHCGCEKGIRCTCNQKALDCQCSKCEETDRNNADHCTCHEKGNKQSAMDRKCVKATEDLKDFCFCKGSQSRKLFCECDKDKPEQQNIPSKCPENPRLFGCKVHRDSENNPCPCSCGRDKTQCEERCLEKKRSNLKTLKLTQSANGDKKKSGHFVCGCDVDGKDDTNCDEKCKYKSSLKEVIENKRQTDCRCKNENAKICDCDMDTEKRLSCGSEKVTNKESPLEMPNIETKKKKTDRDKCGCAYDPDKKTCDKRCKNKPKLTLRRAVPEDRPEESVMVIDPPDFEDSDSFMSTSGSSDYCSCAPGRCKYKATPGDSTCSCDSEVE